MMIWKWRSAHIVYIDLQIIFTEYFAHCFLQMCEVIILFFHIFSHISVNSCGNGRLLTKNLKKHIRDERGGGWLVGGLLISILKRVSMSEKGVLSLRRVEWSKPKNWSVDTTEDNSFLSKKPKICEAKKLFGCFYARFQIPMWSLKIRIWHI